jgi:HlyD family secretion protein
MRKVLIIVVAVVAVAAAGGFGLWYAHAAGHSEAPFRTEEVTRGDLLASFSATGTLEPEDVIDVGAQVAGQIKEFGTDAKTSKPIDYGSEVDAGTVLAKIDDSLYTARVNQSRAKVDEAKANSEQAQAKIDDAKANVKVAEANLLQAQARYNQAKRDWDRALVLGPRQALSQADLDGYQSAYETTKAAVTQNDALVAQAKVAVKEAEAQAVNAKAVIADSEAALSQDEINLGYTTIKAPVKGVVIDRRVTLGQTVQSSFNTPSLFLLARDLKRMKVWASVNEADIGQVHVGQTVTFTVDAHPGQVFTGTVGLIRLNATMTNNVVTYTVEVLTDNSDGKLLPYLTANLHFEVGKRSGALTVSNEALRWKPDVQQVAPDARAAFQKAMQRKQGAEGSTAPPAAAGAHNRGVVWVQEGKFVRPVKVKLGLSDGNRTEVVEGDLREGAAVVMGDALTQGGGDGGSNPFAPQMFGGKKQ